MLKEKLVEAVLEALVMSQRAGMPVTRTEWIHGLPEAVARKLRRGVEAGRPLAELLSDGLGLAAHERVLLEAGELSGTLPDVIDALLQARKLRRTTRRRAMLALAYPVLVLFGAIIFLPLPLLFTESANLYVRVEIVGLGGLFAPLFVAFVLWPRLPPSTLRDLPWTLARMLPILGPRLAWGPTAVFTDVLGRTIAAGVPVTVALPGALAATGDRDFAACATAARSVIEDGGSLADALLKIPDLPPEVVRQVAVGEAAGRLEQVLHVMQEDASARHRRTLWTLIIALGATVCAIAALVAVVGIATAAQTFYFDRIDSLLDAAER